MSGTDRSYLKEWRKKIEGIRKETALESYGTASERRERKLRATKDYKFFVEYYLPNFAISDTPDFHVKAANRIKRDPEIAEWHKWGRGLAKSVFNNVCVPLWLWIQDDIQFLLLIGQNEDKGALLLEDLRGQFEGNLRLINDFGPQKNIGQWEKGFFITKNGFIAKAIGMGQEPRGLRVGPHRPDHVNCDDWETRETQKNQKRQREMAEWLVRSILPTMDGDRQRVTLSQNKFAPRMIFDMVVEENKGWRVDRQDAFDPVTLRPRWKSKYSPDYYKKKVKKMGILAAKAEYNNDPHVEGTIFKDEMIQWTKIPNLNHFDKIVGIWDVALSDSKTADFNAIRVWGIKNKQKYLIDCFVRQSRIRAAIEWIALYQVNLPKSVRVEFYFEEQFWNETILDTIEEVESEYKITLSLSKLKRSSVRKYDRIVSILLPPYQNGKVFYNEKLKDHNDTKEGLAQLKGIEPGYNSKDDAPDADQYAFDYLDQFHPSRSFSPMFSKRTNHRY